MLRRLATWVLLIPLSLNGLWMVCEDAPAKTIPAASEAQDLPDSMADMPDCKTMCPIALHTASGPVASRAQSGSICLVTADGGRSIAIFAFAVSAPMAQMTVLPPKRILDFPMLAASLYFNPTLPLPSPPPKA